ncbi:MAG TPA: hypothetical protein VHX61_00500 [Rhizomicrobium sp.]|jgi:hypothetical protein|nr:hypothetical protein [Rhizomicrobium sp.]
MSSSPPASPATLPRLPVIRTLGGCGGTLLARLFAALPGVILLSETNPRSAVLYGGWLNPVAQIRKWHPALADSVAAFDEYEIGYPPRFGGMLEQVYRSAAAQQLTLVIRDFNYADFIGVPFVWPVPRDCSLDLATKGRFELADIVLVRSPAAQLASLRTHKAILPVLEAESFVEGYRAFLSAVSGAPLFHYETLVAEPADTLASMCAALGLPWDERVLERQSTVETVTGSITRQGDRTIREPELTEAANYAEEELSRISGYKSLVDALGYPLDAGVRAHRIAD